MATNKITMKFRSITYPNNDPTDDKKKRGKLIRTESFDLDPREPLSPGRIVTGGNTSLSTPHRSRNISAEGRLRVHQFQHARSASSTLVQPGLQKTIRFSDECQCSPSVSLSPGARCQPRCSYCLSSQKSKSTNYLRSTGDNSVERLMDWKRKSSDKMNISSSDDAIRHERASRPTERRCERNNDRRNNHCSVSLPPPSDLPSGSVSTPSTPTPGLTSAPSISCPMSSEGRSRKSQFRRAWSLFTLSCDKEMERERRDKPSSQQRILRLPTRHVYRRGLSGLPIDCTPNYLGLAY